MPDYQVNAFHGFLAPAGTPPAIVAKLERDITDVLKTPAIRQKLIDHRAFRMVERVRHCPSAAQMGQVAVREPDPQPARRIAREAPR